MPELPEVETVARGLRELIGCKVSGVEVLWPRTVASPKPASFVRRLKGQQITDVGRRGKWLVLRLDGDDHLLAHLRMSGKLLVEPADSPPDKHARVVIALDDGRRLRFSDQRKFGRMVLTDEPDQVLGKLGPEPLGDEFTPDEFAEMLVARRGRLKPLLLDQSFVAGLGNIYVDESLWRACIHPLRSADSLSKDEAHRLYAAIREVLSQAIAAAGTTLSDRQYVGADGQAGEFGAQLNVYGRSGQQCRRCAAPIERIVVAQRGTHICPRCQPEPET